jgi:hypothetical protein
VVAVAAFGELSPGSLVAVTLTGALVTGLGMARRAGSAAPAARRPGLPLLAVFGAIGLWELLALAGDSLPTLSDLADPVLAPPGARAAATVLWLAAGAWLVTRPNRGDPSVPLPAGRRAPTLALAVAAVMRTTAGRLTVLAVWVWLGVHFLAR